MGTGIGVEAATARRRIGMRRGLLLPVRRFLRDPFLLGVIGLDGLGALLHDGVDGACPRILTSSIAVKQFSIRFRTSAVMVSSCRYLSSTLSLAELILIWVV